MLLSRKNLMRLFRDIQVSNKSKKFLIWTAEPRFNTQYSTIQKNPISGLDIDIMNNLYGGRFF